MALLSGRLLPPTSSKLRLWQDVSGDEKLAGGGEDKLHHGILTASGADGGHRGTLAGTVTLRKHEPVCPKDIQLCREKSKDREAKTHLKAPSALVWLCTGFSVTLPVFHFNIKHYSFRIVQIEHLFFRTKGMNIVRRFLE